MPRLIIPFGVSSVSHLSLLCLLIVRVGSLGQHSQNCMLPCAES